MKLSQTSLTGGAVVIAAVLSSTISAGAAALITGAQIKDGTITSADLATNAVTSAKVKDRSLVGNDVSRDSLTGSEINESRLGRVPRAASADALQGLGASSFLRSSRIQTATVSIIAAGPQVLFTDAHVGVRVEYLPGTNSLELVNIDPSATLGYRGEGGGSGLTTRTGSIVSGDKAVIGFEGNGVYYAHFMVRKRTNPASASALVDFTCMLDDASPGNSFSCVAIS